MGSGKNRFLPFQSYMEWQELVLTILKLWGVARTSSCHLKNCKNSEHRLHWEVMVSGKNRFLPFPNYVDWQELVLAIFKFLGLARTGSCHFKNCRNSEHKLYWEVMGSGRNWFSPLWEWQEVVLAIFKWCQNRLEHQGMGVARTMGMVTIIITIIITITIP